MKFYKFKQVQRLVFSGWDDVDIDNPNSSSRRHKRTRVGINDTKILKFKVLCKNGIQLSNNARIVLESIYVPPYIIPENLPVAEEQAGIITVRMNNLISETFDSTDNNLNSPLLFSCEKPGQFYNNYPKMLYNFGIPQHFLNNGYIEFEVTYPNIGFPSPESLRYFNISLIIYDMNEEEFVLKDTAEVDYKDMRSHLPTNLGMLGLVPNDKSRYKTKKK